MNGLLGDRRIIPMIEIEDADHAVPLAEALLAGGLDVVEVTFRTEAAAEAIDRIAHAVPDMLFGAGTVVTEDQARRAVELGVRFVVSPGFSSRIVDYLRKNSVPTLPGVQTPTEIQAALEAGCTLQKFFPAGAAGGAATLKALSGPFASLGVTFCPTGGVNLDNMLGYLALPTVSCVGGSWLATRKQIADGDWAAITRQAKEAIAKAGELG